MNDGIKKKSILYFIPVIVWMSVIYLLSDKPAPESSVQSEGLALKIIIMLSENSGLSEGEQLERALQLEPVIRDIAHFLEYAILAALLITAIRAVVSDCRRAALIVLLICFLYACSDELHQYYVPGRAAQLIDIVLDTSGAAIVVFIYHIFTNNIHRNTLSDS